MKIENQISKRQQMTPTHSHEDKFFELIENERRERRQDIGEIHSRIDQILEAIRNIGVKKNGNGEASWVRQSVGLSIAVFSIISIMSAIIMGMLAPVNLNIKYIADNLDKVELRAERLVANMDTKLQAQLETISSSTKLSSERNQARLEKLEEWQQWWIRNIPNKDGEQTAQIAHFKTRIEDMRLLLNEKAADRFTGAEGKALQIRLDRMEDRLTFLTKELLRPMRTNE